MCIRDRYYVGQITILYYVDHLDPNLPFWGAVQGLHITDPTPATCPKVCSSNPNPNTTTTIRLYVLLYHMSLWCSVTFFAIDTRYELIVGGHIYAGQPVLMVVMLQAVRVVVHGIFIRPSELAIWFYTTHLTNFSIRSRRSMECFTPATMPQHASRTAEAAEVAISIRPCHTTRFWCWIFFSISEDLHQH